MRGINFGSPRSNFVSLVACLTIFKEKAWLVIPVDFTMAGRTP